MTFIPLLRRATLLSVFLALAVGTALARGETKTSADANGVQQCVNSTIDRFGGKIKTLDAFERINEYCAKSIYWDFIIRDFEYRRQKFVRQTGDDGVLLWMVVGITISGVALSAVQLLASYRLSLLGKANIKDGGGTLSIEAGKLSVQSSVTGLLILGFSFAFFLVFVTSVYQFRDEAVSYPQFAGAPQGPNLGTGGLGPAKPGPPK